MEAFLSLSNYQRPLWGMPHEKRAKYCAELSTNVLGGLFKELREKFEELKTVGLGKYENEKYTENKLRQEQKLVKRTKI
ncbi:MAG: hypothetical protein LW701_12005 [Fluviicola sp.]|jgi:hypothetical protein|nr:hypothetical protein [Fluviicola sp.]